MSVMRPWASRRHSGRVSRIVIPTMGPATLHPLALLYVASGSAMISTIRIPKP